MMSEHNVTEIMDINMLDTDKAEFYISGNGFLGLRYLGKEYERVIVSRILPFSDPDGYISVMDTENNEIGIIRAISGMDPGQSEILRAELAKRYYCPVISRIVSVKEKMGYVYLDVMIKDRSKNFAVKDVSRNIRQLDEKRILIFDVDGNRYIIEDIAGIDQKSIRYLEPYLF